MKSHDFARGLLNMPNVDMYINTYDFDYDYMMFHKIVGFTSGHIRDAITVTTKQVYGDAEPDNILSLPPIGSWIQGECFHLGHDQWMDYDVLLWMKLQGDITEDGEIAVITRYEDFKIHVEIMSVSNYIQWLLAEEYLLPEDLEEYAHEDCL